MRAKICWQVKVVSVLLLFFPLTALAVPAPIYGTVFGYDGKPLAGAKVTAWDQDELQSGGLLKDDKMGSDITGPDGKYRIVYKSYDEKHWDGPKTSAHTNWRPDIYLVVEVPQQYKNKTVWSKRYVEEKPHMNHKMRDPLKIDIRLPPGKCGAGEVLECSIPWIAQAFVHEQSVAKRLFNKACKRHDYCYRHGYLTYKKSRKDCDDDFLNDMQDKCNNSTAAILLSFGLSAAACNAIAGEVYAGVRAGGEDAFRKENGSECEYDGQPIGGGGIGRPPHTTNVR